MILIIVVGIIVLSVLIIVHELGHLIAAKATGVWVEEFGIGFPPRVYGKKWGETIYSINWIPFGGFNKLSGEVDPSATRSLAGKSYGTRLMVLSAGSLMNILLAFLLFSITFMIPHDMVTGEVLVEKVAPNSPAAMAGVEAGDIILSVNDKPVDNETDLSRYIQLNLGKEVNLMVRHSDATIEELQLIPRWKPPEGEGAMGVAFTISNPTVVSQSYPFWEAVPMGVNGLIETTILYKNLMIGVIIGAIPAQFIGPVGIVQATGEVATKFGIRPLLEFAALISLILGIVNLFPIPALDGGRIVFVLLEWVRRGKRISARTEGLVHAIGFVLLMAVLLIITYQDVIRIISGESLIP